MTYWTRIILIKGNRINNKKWSKNKNRKITY